MATFTWVTKSDRPKKGASVRAKGVFSVRSVRANKASSPISADHVRNEHSVFHLRKVLKDII